MLLLPTRPPGAVDAREGNDTGNKSKTMQCIRTQRVEQGEGNVTRTKKANKQAAYQRGNGLQGVVDSLSVCLPYDAHGQHHVVSTI